MTILMQYLRNLAEEIWAASMNVIELCYQWCLDLLNEVLVFCINEFYSFLEFVYSLFPRVSEAKMPTLPPMPGIFNQVNYYVPISEAITLFGMWSGIFVIVGVIKYAKFIRGGG